MEKTQVNVWKNMHEIWNDFLFFLEIKKGFKIENPKVHKDVGYENVKKWKRENNIKGFLRLNDYGILEFSRKTDAALFILFYDKEKSMEDKLHWHDQKNSIRKPMPAIYRVWH